MGSYWRLSRMIPIGIVAVAGVVPKTIPSPTISTTNFNAYTNNITISAPVGIPVSSYILESSTSASGPWTSVYQGASASYQHTGLTQTTTYFYRARYSKGSLTSYVGNTFSRATRTSSVKSAQFRDNGTWTKPVGVTNVSYFLIGSGGNGGNALRRRYTASRNTSAGGGGGAGQLIVVQNATVPSAQTDYAITSGTGVSTTFMGNTAIKGGNGATDGFTAAQTGAHGGGGGVVFNEDGLGIADVYQSGGTSTIGGNSGGSAALNKSRISSVGGGGAGTGGAGGNATTSTSAGSGGSSSTVVLNGQSWSNIGAGGAGAYVDVVAAAPGANRSQATGFGQGGQGAQSGAEATEGTTYTGGLGGKGAVVISWRD